MKKWIVLALIVCVAGVVQGKPTTKEDYLASREKSAQKDGKEFDKEKTAAYFDKFDLNKDGVHDDEEKALKAEQEEAKKKKQAEKKAAKKKAAEEE